ncbi:transposase [Streptomyces sp. NPDC026673]|uniref:transposase n=1 Tax=Streptomyces sp. NPDC026673 TaxID=3155724 RepID=UPI0033F0623B
MTEVAHELGVGAEGLRGWVKQVKAGRGEGPAGALTGDEREELRRVRREIGTTVWESGEAARADVFRFIEVEYNRTRPRGHPEFGYLTPLETRARLQEDFTPAA